jgi:hypothetical protein
MRNINGRCKLLQRFVALTFASIAMIGIAIGSSYSTNVTDVWYNPSQSGKGVQLIQTGSFVFVTVYTYGSDGEATWVTGELRPSASATWTGPLFVNTGPYFGGPFDAAPVAQREAGTMTFVLQSINAGLLTYSVDGVPVSDPLQRLPLTLDDYNGSYHAVLTSTTTGCSDPANNGTDTSNASVQITQVGQSMTVATVDSDQNTCTIVGTYSQQGLNGTLLGPYSCTTGDAGNAQIFDMRNTYHQFNARFVLSSTKYGCSSTGRITGLVPN